MAINLQDAPYNCDPTGFTDATAAIQAAIDFLYANPYQGGKIIAPAGRYVASGLVVKGSITIEGEGRGCTIFDGSAQNSDTIHFDTTAGYAGLRDAQVWGFNGANPGSNALSVADNIPVDLTRLNAFFGYAALYTRGIDGRYDNCYFFGQKYCVTSQGANWYSGCKLDDGDASQKMIAAFLQGTSIPNASSAENHFVSTDFSGNYQQSILIDDAGQHFNETIVVGGVISSPILIRSGRAVILSSLELGANITNQDAKCAVLISNTWGLTKVTVSGPNISTNNANVIT